MSESMFTEGEQEFPHPHEFINVPPEFAGRVNADNFCQVCLLGRKLVPMKKVKGLASMEEAMGQIFRNIETHQIPELKVLQRRRGGKLYPIHQRKSQR